MTMVKELRNYMLKSSAIIGAVGTLLYFAPTEKLFDQAPEVEKSKDVETTRSSQTKKYENMRKPASSELQALSNEEEELFDEEQYESSNDTSRNDNYYEEPGGGTLANTSAPYENSGEIENDQRNEQQRSEQDYQEEDLQEDEQESNEQDNFETDVDEQVNDESSNDNYDSSDNPQYAIPGCSENCAEDIDSESETNNNSNDTSVINESSTSTARTIASEEAPVVSADLGSGNYSAPPTVNLSSNSGGEIYYCVAEGSCCEPAPADGGSLYNSALEVGTVDGNYCLSFVGLSSSGLLGETVTQSYVVDQTLPNMTSVVDVQYIQSTQESSISIDSTNFGEAGFDYGLYNLSADPSALNCEQVEDNFAHATYGVDFDGNATPDFYDLSGIISTITTPLRPSIMNYGSAGNYFVSILANRNFLGGAKRNCVTHKVILEDFDYFASTQNSTSAPAVNGGGQMEISGSFNSYGIFRAPAAIGDNTITSGSSRFEADSSNILETTKEEIIY